MLFLRNNHTHLFVKVLQIKTNKNTFQLEGTTRFRIKF